MTSGAKLFGHPIHQSLVAFPLGLLGGSVIFDIVHFVRGGNWSLAAWYMIAVGVLSGLGAAVFGFVGWLAIPPATRAKSIGAWHGIGNVIVVLLFACSWYLRRPDIAHPTMAAFGVGLVGFGLAIVTGWLGGELVDRLGIGVDEGANPNARSSLSGPVHRGM